MTGTYIAPHGPMNWLRGSSRRDKTHGGGSLLAGSSTKVPLSLTHSLPHLSPTSSPSTTRLPRHHIPAFVQLPHFRHYHTKCMILCCTIILARGSSVPNKLFMTCCRLHPGPHNERTVCVVVVCAVGDLQLQAPYKGQFEPYYFERIPFSTLSAQSDPKKHPKMK